MIPRDVDVVAYPGVARHIRRELPAVATIDSNTVRSDAMRRWIGRRCIALCDGTPSLDRAVAAVPGRFPVSAGSASLSFQVPEEGIAGTVAPGQSAGEEIGLVER